jgi:hypothetical protein
MSVHHLHEGDRVPLHKNPRALHDSHLAHIVLGHLLSLGLWSGIEAKVSCNVLVPGVVIACRVVVDPRLIR